MQGALPRLYAILDAELIARRELDLYGVAEAFRRAGVQLLQYRDKLSGPSEILKRAEQLRELFAGSGCILILNDWPALAVQAGWDGVHVGQGDMDIEAARHVVGPGRWLGVSTHTPQQLGDAERSSADYVAIGPVFATSTKVDAEAVVGLEGVRSARSLVTKPLVAIGGINRFNARAVIEVGADAVAVVSDLLSGPKPIEETTSSFLASLGQPAASASPGDILPRLL